MPVFHLNIKKNVIGRTENDGTKNTDTWAPLKYLSNFLRTLEMALLILISGCVDNQLPKFEITDTKLYVPVVTLSNQENVKLLDQLKSGFKRTINWNEYQLKLSIETQNQYLHYLIDPIFQQVNRLFVLPFKNNAD